MAAPIKQIARSFLGGRRRGGFPFGFPASQSADSSRLNWVPGVLLFLAIAAPLFAQEVPIPPAPTRWVTDTAGFMSPLEADRLDARLRAYEEQTGHQLVVWIGRTTGDAPIDDWANRAFEAWGVGRDDLDDGLALFIMSEDRRLRIEVGYGLEGQVADILASRIVNDIIIPRIQAGDPVGGVTAGMEAVAETIGMPLPGASEQPRAGGDRQPRSVSFGQLIVYAILGLIFLTILATNPTLAMWLLVSFLSGGHRRGGGGFGRGGGFGGGGFRGGGGLSGGGGAGGSW